MIETGEKCGRGMSATTTYREGSVKLLSPLIVCGIEIHTVASGLGGGVAKALHAQHCLFGCAKHGIRLTMQGTLQKRKSPDKLKKKCIKINRQPLAVGV